MTFFIENPVFPCCTTYSKEQNLLLYVHMKPPQAKICVARLLTYAVTERNDEREVGKIILTQGAAFSNK